ncbi:MAG: 1-deoxy-D-xylulose-5-phosphate reductoisomerase, partial [Phycisphaerae bacterium]|nr:1-deoxy-D-xylulose-5-phosphate reductoisomerase [Phycisphaerae bacterium]
DVIEHLGPEYSVAALSAHSQADKLIAQAKKYRPVAVAVSDNTKFDGVADVLRPLGCQMYRGAVGVAEMVCRHDIDVVLAAIVGAAGLPPVLAAVRSGKTIALANKESLVVAGSLLIPEAKRRGVAILPVDSEHSAVFQAMVCGKSDQVRRIILTASGGPFRNTPAEVMHRATLDDALNHPTWRMGNKISIDSATMFNKGLEVIEACWLFDVPPEKIEVVVHPESVVHSMVEFVDGSVMAQLSPPDMRTPIQYALTYPERRDGISRKLDLTKSFSLNFQPPDFDRFPALSIAYEVAARRGTLGAVMNAANEAAVDAFVAGRLPFGMISRCVRLTIDRHQHRTEPTLEELLEADRWARETARTIAANELH